MGEKVFYGKGIRRIKKENPELYDSIENLDKNVWNAHALDYRTQKLIAIAISATKPESSSFLKQVSKAKVIKLSRPCSLSRLDNLSG